MGRKRIWPPKVNRHPKGQDRVWWRGRWYDLGPSGSDQAKAEYARLLALWATDPHAAPGRPVGELLLSELCRDYLASKKAPAESRQRGILLTAVGLLREQHPVTAAAGFGAVELAAWQERLAGLPHPKRGTRFNRTHVGHLVNAVRRMFRWAVTTGRLPVEAWQALLAVSPPGPGEVREGRDVEPADPAAVRQTVPLLRPPVRAMALLQWMTGARPDELCGLRPADVRRAGKVHVPGAGLLDLDAAGVWVAVPRQHKGKSRRKPRWLTFDAAAQDVLRPFLDRPPEAFCFSPREAVESLRAEQRAARLANGGGSGGSRKKAGPARRKPGERYTDKSYHHAVARAAARAGVAHWFPYQLRHLAAAEVKAAFGVDAVQALLGHHTRTMAEHYGGTSFTLAARAASRPSGATGPNPPLKGGG